MKITSGPFKGKEIKIAEQDVVDQHAAIVDEILDAIGIGGALVTDLTELCDFGLSDFDLAELNRRFGLSLATTTITLPILIGMILKARATPTTQ